MKRIIISLAALFCLIAVFGVASGTIAPIAPAREMPSEVEPGECFNVTINFTLPADSLLIFLYDEAPTGWDTSIVSSEPPANLSSTDFNKVIFTWNVSYPAGTDFYVIYNVCVPDDAAPGRYRFEGNITYFAGYTQLPQIIAMTNNYTSIRAPAAVPTISPIGIIMMSLLLTAIAAMAIRKKSV